jgi:hypothetical protein
VAGRREETLQIALAIVARHQPCTPELLINTLGTEYGVSSSEAAKTLLQLIRDGRVNRSAFGELSVPGVTAGGPGHGYPPVLKAVVVALLGAIVVFLAWVFYNLATAESGPPADFPNGAPADHHRAASIELAKRVIGPVGQGGSATP